MADLTTGGSVTCTNYNLSIIAYSLNIEQDVVQLEPSIGLYTSTPPILDHATGDIRITGTLTGYATDDGIPVDNALWANYTAAATFVMSTSRSISMPIIITRESVERRKADTSVTLDFRNYNGTVTIA